VRVVAPFVVPPVLPVLPVLPVVPVLVERVFAPVILPVVPVLPVVVPVLPVVVPVLPVVVPVLVVPPPIVPVLLVPPLFIMLLLVVFALRVVLALALPVSDEQLAPATASVKIADNVNVLLIENSPISPERLYFCILTATFLLSILYSIGKPSKVMFGRLQLA
jgi:signal-induced proliferation-associated 1 like protein 3